MEGMCIFRLFSKKDENSTDISANSVVPTSTDIDEFESFDDIFDDDWLLSVFTQILRYFGEYRLTTPYKLSIILAL